MKKKFFQRQDDIIVIKRLTYSRMFLVLYALFLIDSVSSFYAVQHPNIYEVNNNSSFFFELGLNGLYAWCFLGIFLIGGIIFFLYTFEKAYFQSNAQQIRMKIFYVILGMYALVFSSNLRVLINTFLN